ncbi:hypothetical protein SDC9_199888 [bioreactor metagenome]|uniref:Uncharacterized protein n=1 Tax=bioreactor metagenome TaxID=1076179 RepID=A0A645IN07_9ZZZZ
MRSKGRRCHHRQPACRPQTAHCSHCRLEAVHALAQLGQHRLALGGQFKRARQTMKQAHAEMSLQTTDLVADRRWRHRQLFGRTLEAQMTRGGFEGPECIERRQMNRHMDE